MKNLKFFLLGVCLWWGGTGFAMQQKEFSQTELNEIENAAVQQAQPIIDTLAKAISAKSQEDFATPAFNSIKNLAKTYLPTATAGNKDKAILLMIIMKVTQWLTIKEIDDQIPDYSKKQINALIQKLHEYSAQFKTKKLLSDTLIEQDDSNIKIAPKTQGKKITKKK